MRVPSISPIAFAVVMFHAVCPTAAAARQAVNARWTQPIPDVIPALTLPEADLPARRVSIALTRPAARTIIPMPAGQPGSPRTASMAVSGAVGGAIGLVAGGYGGLYLANACAEGIGNPVCLAPVFLGFFAEAAGVSLGVHLANGSRGEVWPSIWSSVGIASAGVVAAAATGEGAIVLPLMLAAQVINSIAIERRTSR